MRMQENKPLADMPEREAIARIQDHMRVHKIGEHHHFKIADALKLAIVALQRQAEMMNNKPLTLDELREIAGKTPVYIVGDDERELRFSEWAMVLFEGAPEGCAAVWFLYRDYDDNPAIENYGKTWFAYRLKPKEDA